MAAKKEPIVRTTIRVPKSLWEQAKHKAIDDGVSLQELVIQAITKIVAKGEK
jgi:predicted HicB family RNase H-like nuclease